jgi:hypothetical protein
MVEDLAVSVARSHLPGTAARGQALAQVRVPVNWIAPPPTLRKPSRTHSAKASAGPCCAANVDTSRRGPWGERRTPLATDLRELGASCPRHSAGAARRCGAGPPVAPEGKPVILRR